jgi:hypothetical protein
MKESVRMMSDKMKTIRRLGQDVNAAEYGEGANTSSMKLVKTDVELANELRELLEDVVHVMTKLHVRGMFAEIGLDNGFGPFKYPKLVNFSVKKKIVDWQTEDRPAQGPQQ